MRNPGQIHLALPLALTLVLAACGASAPDDESAPVPAAVEQEAGEVQAAPDEAVAAPVPDPDAPLPEAAMGEHGMLQPWAVAAQMGGGMQALAEGCGIEGEAGFDDMDAEARDRIQALGADMEAFEGLWKQTHAKAERDFAAGTTEQRAESCAELEELRRMSAQYGEGITQP